MLKAVTLGLALIAVAFIGRGFITEAKAGGQGWRQDQCRYKTAGGRAWSYNDERRVVICAATKENPPGGVAQALSVWGCERPDEPEAPHAEPYHGPMQYLRSTFASQQARMPAVLHHYELGHGVHNIRANIVTAMAWAARHGWGPWSCA